MDVDKNAFEQAHAVGSPMVVEAARFYIYGDRSNPLVEQVDNASTIINQVEDVYGEFRWAVSVISSACRPLRDLEVAKLLTIARSMLREARWLVAASTVWPYYDDLVHGTFCTGIP